MFHPFRKFVAVLLAIWLPLFSGSALAASVAMKTTSGDCHPVADQSIKQHTHHVSTAHHHGQPAAIQDRPAGQHDHQSTSCKDCGVCHFACSGYLATIGIIVSETGLSAQTYTSSLTQFHSFTSALLDPPPLSRV